MLIIQAFLICILLTTIVKIAVGNDAVNGAYFYPKEIQQRLIELGRTDQKTISRKRKICMTSFYVVLPVAMLLIIGCWNGVSDFKTAYLQELAIYDVHVIDKKGIFLNEKEFLPHEVVYRLPPQISDAGTRVEQVRRDLERLIRMGVNVIRLEGTGTGAEGVNCSEVRTFYSLCRKRGFLTGDLWIRPEKLPVYRGLPGETTCQALLAADGRTLTERYYYYQAKWSSEPVLYPVLSTLHRQENGLLSLTIYSNQKKVVLYVDGVLFLFQTATSGDPEFIFEDIPVAKLPLHLAAEAGNLSISLTVTKL